MLLKRMKDKNVQSCKLLNYNNGYSPFFLPIIYNPKILKLSQKRFTNALLAEGIPIGTNYGCLVSTWKWTKNILKGFTNLEML